MVVPSFLSPPTLPQDAERVPGAVLSGCVADLHREEWDRLP